MPEEGRFECDGSTSLTDEQIIQRVLGGDDRVFGIIMLRYNQRLYRAARSILRDESLAEDVIQQAYINAYFHLRRSRREVPLLDVAYSHSHQRGACQGPP